MGSLDPDHLPEDALLLLDSAPVVYIFEKHPQFAPRFRPLFVAQSEGRLKFAVTPITVAEVLTGPLQAGNEALTARYRARLSSWQLVEFNIDIAENAARFRASLHLKLADALQVASALAIDATALVTADRDFSRVRSLRVIS
jgi:predicted nucleic acid-binding protein